MFRRKLIDEKRIAVTLSRHYYFRGMFGTRSVKAYRTCLPELYLLAEKPGLCGRALGHRWMCVDDRAVAYREVRAGDANLQGDGKHGGRAHNSLGRILGGARTRVYTRRDGWTRQARPGCTHARTRVIQYSALSAPTDRSPPRILSD